MNQITIVSRYRTCTIEVAHRDSNPDAWIVLRWTRTKLAKKRISSHSFIDKKQAFAFAVQMKRAHEMKEGSDDLGSTPSSTKTIPHRINQDFDQMMVIPKVSGLRRIPGRTPRPLSNNNK